MLAHLLVESSVAIVQIVLFMLASHVYKFNNLSLLSLNDFSGTFSKKELTPGHSLINLPADVLQPCWLKKSPNFNFSTVVNSHYVLLAKIFFFFF